MFNVLFTQHSSLFNNFNNENTIVSLDIGIGVRDSDIELKSISGLQLG